MTNRLLTFYLYVTQTTPTRKGPEAVEFEHTVKARDLREVFHSCQRLFGKATPTILEEDVIEWQFTKLNDERTGVIKTSVAVTGDGVRRRYGYRLDHTFLAKMDLIRDGKSARAIVPGHEQLRLPTLHHWARTARHAMRLAFLHESYDKFLLTRELTGAELAVILDVLEDAELVKRETWGEDSTLVRIDEQRNARFPLGVTLYRNTDQRLPPPTLRDHVKKAIRKKGTQTDETPEP